MKILRLEDALVACEELVIELGNWQHYERTLKRFGKRPFLCNTNKMEDKHGNAILIKKKYMNDNVNNPADGKHVVIENGQRVTAPLSKEEAEAEARKRNQVAESGGKSVPENRRAQVKQNILG